VDRSEDMNEQDVNEAEGVSIGSHGVNSTQCHNQPRPAAQSINDLLFDKKNLPQRVKFGSPTLSGMHTFQIQGMVFPLIVNTKLGTFF